MEREKLRDELCYYISHYAKIAERNCPVYESTKFSHAFDEIMYFVEDPAEGDTSERSALDAELKKLLYDNDKDFCLLFKEAYNYLKEILKLYPAISSFTSKSDTLFSFDQQYFLLIMWDTIGFIREVIKEVDPTISAANLYEFMSKKDISECRRFGRTFPIWYFDDYSAALRAVAEAIKQCVFEGDAKLI